MERRLFGAVSVVLLLLILFFSGTTTALGQSIEEDGIVDGPPVIGDPNDFPEPAETDDIEAAAPEFILS